MKDLLRKSILGLILFLVVIIAVFYFITKSQERTNIIDSIASILAVPSFILSIFVFKTIDIKLENLDAYYYRRKMSDDTKRRNQKKAEEAFKDKLKEIEDLCKKYDKYLKNKTAKEESAKSSINACQKGCCVLRDFFDETKDYIFDDFLPKMENLGGLKTIGKIDVVIIEVKDKAQLNKALLELKSEMFGSNMVNEKENQLLELLFGDSNGLMTKYVKTCFHAYKEIEEK